MPLHSVNPSLALTITVTETGAIEVTGAAIQNPIIALGMLHAASFVVWALSTKGQNVQHGPSSGIIPGTILPPSTR